MVDYTTVNISKKHSKLLEKISERNRRDKKAQLELMIEQEDEA